MTRHYVKTSTDQLLTTLVAGNLSLLLGGSSHTFLNKDDIGQNCQQNGQWSYLSCDARAVMAAWSKIPFAVHSLLAQITLDSLWDLLDTFLVIG